MGGLGPIRYLMEVYSPPRNRHDRPPGWLWPTRLALDAPLVAVGWQRFLAAAFGVPVPAAVSVALGLTVWAVYLADRWLDADPLRPGEPADRHQFARRHRRWFGRAAVLASLAAGAVILTLPREYLTTGSVVGVGLLIYLSAVHFGWPARLVVGEKEFAVGLVFAAGVAVPLLASPRVEPTAWLPAAGAFAAVCWLNCGLIARWEAGPADPVPSDWLIVAAAACAGGLTAFAPVKVRLAVGLAVAGLLALHLARGRVGTPARRVLADAALLAPLAVGW